MTYGKLAKLAAVGTEKWTHWSSNHQTSNQWALKLNLKSERYREVQFSLGSTARQLSGLRMLTYPVGRDV